MKNSSYLLTIVFLLNISCIDQYEIDLPFSGPRMVLDVVVSDNSDVSQVTLGWTYPASDGCFWEDEFVGRIPTLCPPDTSAGPYRVTGSVNISDIEAGTAYDYPIQMADKKGFIQFPISVDAVPGHTYRLHVSIKYNDETENYYSETVMKPTPAIDNITYEVRKGDVGKNDNYVPLISFLEPSASRDYYLFQICMKYGNDQISCGHSRVWGYSVLSDRFLPESVVNLSIDDGATVARYADFYPPAFPGDVAVVRMYSVSQEVYGFYKSLLEQFVNDGGAYAPTPATPGGNITGGAIGLFRVLDESSAEIQY